MNERAADRRPGARRETDAGRAETVAQKQRRIFASGRDTERLVYFSDAVFAIAVTLLVLDIRVPTLDEGESLWIAVLDLWPKYLGYALSFAIIAINWVFHHRKFRAIERFDAGLIWINLVFLFFVALVPFPTSLLSEYAPDVAAVTLYAAIVAVLGLVSTVLWVYAHRAGLMGAEVDPGLFRLTTANNLVVPVVFLASIPVALFVDPGVAMWCWILNWPVSVIVGVWFGRRPADPDPVPLDAD